MCRGFVGGSRCAVDLGRGSLGFQSVQCFAAGFDHVSNFTQKLTCMLTKLEIYCLRFANTLTMNNRADNKNKENQLEGQNDGAQQEWDSTSRRKKHNYVGVYERKHDSLIVVAYLK